MAKLTINIVDELPAERPEDALYARLAETNPAGDIMIQRYKIRCVRIWRTSSVENALVSWDEPVGDHPSRAVERQRRKESSYVATRGNPGLPAGNVRRRNEYAANLPESLRCWLGTRDRSWVEVDREDVMRKVHTLYVA